MGEDKVDVLLRVSETNLSRAEKRYAEGEYDSAVFHASLAVENVSNAMILLLGGDEAKDHRAISGLTAVVRRIKPELLGNGAFKDAMERGREIQREAVYTRYPLLKGGKWITPMEYYSRERSRGIVKKAKLVVKGIRWAMDSTPS